MRIGRTGLVVALAALLAAGVAVGARALTTAGGDVQACVGKVTGLVRIVADPSACRNWENALSWPGSIPAATGPTAYAHENFGPAYLTNPASPAPGPYTLVGALSLPAGDFLVNAKLVVSNRMGFRTGVRCVLRAPSTSTVDEASTVLDEGGWRNEVQTLALQKAISLPAAATVELRCLVQSVTGLPDVVAGEIKMAALTVGSLVRQP